MSAPAEQCGDERQLAQVALALAAYHAGPWQASGGAGAKLAPAYLPTVPDDLFVEKPLIYHTSADGYVLYSIGPNQQDERRERTRRRRGRPGKPDDLIVHAPAR